MWIAKHLISVHAIFVGNDLVDRLSLIEFVLISCSSGLPRRFCLMIGQTLLLCRQDSVVLPNRFRALIKEALTRGLKSLKI
jgi:hypothetical protein